jgi:hypothetical protein
MEKLNKNSLLTTFIVFLLFTTSTGSASAAGPATVNLGSAGDFTILAKSGISTTGATSITGDIGISPISATGLTGFGLILDSSNRFSTSALLTGKAYAADYTAPTPAKMSTAISDMEIAYTDAAGKTNPTATELGGGNIGGMVLAPGLYKWSSDVTIPTDLTLSGGANDIWIFQIAQNLTISSSMEIVLSGGAQASNIFWQVAGQTTLGTNSVFNGTILDQTAIVLNTGAKLNGRALAQTAVTLDANIVLTPALSTPTPTPTATISANPTSITSGGSSTLSWLSSDAISCSGTNFETGNATSGNVSVSPITNTTYSINCSGALDSVVLSVVQPTPTPTPTPAPTPTATPSTPIDGLCAPIHYSCTTGTSGNTIETATLWEWTCTGFNTGSVVSCSETKSLTTTLTPISTTPSLPNTGISPDATNTPWSIVLPVGIFALLISFYLARKKQHI